MIWVANTAIQGLNQTLEEREQLLRGELKNREAEVDELKRKNAEMENRLGALEKLMTRLERRETAD